VNSGKRNSAIKKEFLTRILIFISSIMNFGLILLHGMLLKP